MFLLKVSHNKRKLEWDHTPFYEELTNTALKSYSKHAINLLSNANKKQNLEDTKNNKNFFSNFPEMLKEIFGFEKKKKTNEGIVEEVGSLEGDIHRKIECMKNEAQEPFVRKPNMIEKNQFHFALNKKIPDFTQINPIYLSETDILENESFLS